MGAFVLYYNVLILQTITFPILCSYPGETVMPHKLSFDQKRVILEVKSTSKMHSSNMSRGGCWDRCQKTGRTSKSFKPEPAPLVFFVTRTDFAGHTSQNIPPSEVDSPPSVWMGTDMWKYVTEVSRNCQPTHTKAENGPLINQLLDWRTRRRDSGPDSGSFSFFFFFLCVGVWRTGLRLWKHKLVWRRWSQMKRV